MRIKEKTANNIGKYFDRTLDIRVQTFNLLAFIGMAAGIIVAILGAILKGSIGTIAPDFLVSVLSYVMLRFAEKTKRYKLCSWIFVIVAFFVFFPMLFFYCGGYKSGAGYAFFIALVFTAILLDKHERVIALALELLLYISCCLLAYYKPEMATTLSSDFEYVFMSLMNFVTTVAILLIALMMQTRIFYAKQKQVQELNRELSAQAETLARYNRMKSDFLATVAHEINTPLAVIAASSNDTLDLLREPPMRMDEIIENQETIGRRVKLIDNILSDLLDTAAIENGRLSLNRRFVNLSELLINTCEAQFKKLNINGSSIVFDLQEDLPQVWADPPRIEQVMTNLLSNAVMHTSRGVITVRLSRAGSSQIVSVADTGEGMDAETAQTALKQYVSTKADSWRHGIGLYICSQIITAHGGDIRIASAPGQGTAITFSLSEEQV